MYELVQQLRAGKFGDGALVLEQLMNAPFDDDECGDSTPSSFPGQHSKIRGFMINYIYIINSNFTSNFVITWNFMGKSWWCKEEGKVDRN